MAHSGTLLWEHKVSKVLIRRSPAPFRRAYPFALPCFVGAAMGLVAIAAGVVFLREVGAFHIRPAC